MPRPYVTVPLDKERPIRFDLNTEIALEDKYGIDFDGLDKFLKECLKNGTKFRFLLYHMLRSGDETFDLTEEQVGRMLDFEKINEIQESLMSQVKASVEDKEAQKNV